MKLQNNSDSSPLSIIDSPVNNHASTSISEAIVVSDEIKSTFNEALNFKRLGNELLIKKKNISTAIEYLKQAISGIDFCSENYKSSSIRIDEIKVECYTNTAYCYFLKKDYTNVVEYTAFALKYSKNNYKALSLKYKALKELNRYNEALDTIKAVRILLT